MATFDGDDRDQHLSDVHPERPILPGIVGYARMAGGDGEEKVWIPVYEVPQHEDVATGDGR